MIKTSVTLEDLDYVEGETTELGLAMAVSKCFQQLRFSKNVQTFQPVMSVLVNIPSEYSGEVISDVNTRKGKILSIETKGTKDLIEGSMPLKKMFGYTTDLRSKTQGRGSYSMKFHEYQGHLACQREMIYLTQWE